MADVEFLHARDARDGSDVVVVEAVSRVDPQSDSARKRRRVAQARELGVALGSARGSVRSRVQLDERRAELGGRRGCFFAARRTRSRGAAPAELGHRARATRSRSAITSSPPSVVSSRPSGTMQMFSAPLSRAIAICSPPGCTRDSARCGSYASIAPSRHPGCGGDRDQ
jgi:hypothetical protein